MSGEYPIKTLCVVLAVSRRGYYAWVRSCDSAHARRGRELRAKIARVHQQSRSTYGSLWITAERRLQILPQPTIQQLAQRVSVSPGTHTGAFSVVFMNTEERSSIDDPVVG